VKFTGTVSKAHFSQFYGLMVTWEAEWSLNEDHPDGIWFDIEVPDRNVTAFKKEVCRLLPCVELNAQLTLFQRLKNFLTKGENCDQCC
jgi:hypothetical protein